MKIASLGAQPLNHKFQTLRPGGDFDAAAWPGDLKTRSPELRPYFCAMANLPADPPTLKAPLAANCRDVELAGVEVLGSGICMYTLYLLG